MCTNLFNGFFTLWITQLIASFFLFWSMVRSSSYLCVLAWLQCFLHHLHAFTSASSGDGLVHVGILCPRRVRA
jgi:hypothetical protein